MSIQAVGWVLDNSQSRGVTRLVLIALANRSNGETGECFPSMRTIAKEAAVSLGTVAKSVGLLVELGELEVVEHGTERRSSRYRLTFQRSPGERSGVQDVNAASTPGVNAAFSPGVNRTITDHQEPSSFAQAKPEPYSAEFEAWWSGYPRKDDKRGAFNAFKARRRAGITLERLTEARDRYLVAKADELDFLKYGKSFLEHNDGPWSEWELYEAPSIEALMEPASGPTFVTDCEQSRPVEPRKSKPCPLNVDGCRDGYVVHSGREVKCECSKVPA